MAILHFSVKSLNRGAGRSAVAAAAYRSGERLHDVRTGETWDYRRRSGVLFTTVVLPDGSTWEREKLWNLAEQAEKRKDAKVAREIVLALPCELTPDKQKALLMGYVEGLSLRAGWGVDVALHAPGKGGDQRNLHAHLLCTTREIEREGTGEPVVGRKTREWDVCPTSKELVASERSAWGFLVNQALEQAGREERVDVRSYEEQGLEILPTQHVGVHANAMELRGERTERGDHNRDVQAHNAKVTELKDIRERRESEQAWQKEYQRLARLPLSALRVEVGRLYPESVEALVNQDDSVLKAKQAMDEVEKAHWRKQKDIVEVKASMTLLQQETEAWRKEHPVYTRLHDLKLPFCQQPALSELEASRTEHEDYLAEAHKTLPELEKSVLAQHRRLEVARQTVRPAVEQLHKTQSERYEQAKILLEKRKTQEQGRDSEQDRGRGR